MMKKKGLKSSKTKKNKPSSLITKDKLYAFKPKSKNITVTTIGKNGYINRYIPNTVANRNEIVSLKGKPDVYGGRYIWM